MRSHIRVLSILSSCLLSTALLQAQPASQPKLDLVLLIENSPVVTSYLPLPKLDSLTSGNRVSVMAFGKSRVSTPFTSNPKEVARALKHLGKPERPENAHLWDALLEATKSFDHPPEPGRRRAVVVLSAGRDNSQNATPAIVFEALKQSGVILGAVIVNQPYRTPSLLVTYPPARAEKPESVPSSSPFPPSYPAAMFDLVKLSSKTGGATDSLNNLNKLLEQLRH